MAESVRLGDNENLAANRRIFEIANEIESAFNEWEGHFIAERFNEWIDGKAKYSDVLLKHVDEIATLTGNSKDNIKLVLGINRSEDSPVSPTYLRNVARYDSFNDHLWKKYSGEERAPTWTDEEIMNGASPEKFERIQAEREDRFRKAREKMGYVQLERIEKPQRMKI